ncbi:hypothetical protein [Simkania negevensis]|uniref:Uncharacterized protein n=1 Tax=Simkania negevensis (strain ATCC VR-1471 / DSM 27360 / Z) TaxID=331113 RepID=F8L7L5_SIMNZ|nr:hypothetical protein [Simkania negevensis]CCB88748.1 unknown protein [Simkania negevensis Z]
MSLSVEYSYSELNSMGLSLPYFLIARSNQSHAYLEGCIKITIVFPEEGMLKSRDPKKILQIWIDWNKASQQMQTIGSSPSHVDFLERGKVKQLFEAAQAAAKQYQEEISNVGISIERQWETIY